MPFDTNATESACLAAWVLSALWAALLLCWPWFRETALRLIEAQQKRRVGTFVVFVLLVLAFRLGATKIPVIVSDRIANFITLKDGQIYGDESGLVTSYARLASTAEFESQTGAIIASVSNGMAAVDGRLDGLLATATSNAAAPRIYYRLDAPRDWPGVVTNHNITITREKSAVNTNTQELIIWWRYSWEIDAAAFIDIPVYANSNQVFHLTASTNSFPETETILNEDGISIECYRAVYPYAAPAAAAGVTLPPNPVFLGPYEAEFGSDTEPVQVPGEGFAMVTGYGTTNAVTHYGGTGWIRHWPEPFGTNLQVHVTGAVADAVLWRGENIDTLTITE